MSTGGTTSGIPSTSGGASGRTSASPDSAAPAPWAQPARPDLTLFNFISENADGARWMPVGALYVVGALEAAGFAVELRDLQLFHPDLPPDREADRYHPETLAAWLATARAPVIGIGLMIDLLPVTLLAVEILKARRPDVTVVLAGPGPSNLVDEILARHPAVDVIVRGEGEETAVELLGALRDGRSLHGIAGLAFRDRAAGGGADVVVNPQRARNAALTELPLPAYHRIQFDEYRSVGVVFSRGCIFKCEFCEIPFIWDQGVQRRSIDNIVQELVHLRDVHGVRRVEILDDLFVSNRRWTREFCQALLREKVGMQWSCFGYISLMTEELMELMKAAGCAGIFYGIESGSPAVLARTGKKFGVEQARKTVLQTLKHLKPTSSFIWNYPYESLSDFYDTVSELVYLHGKGSDVRLFLLCPLKPTPFARAEAALRFDPGLWCHVLRRNRYLHASELIRADPDLFGAFYHFETEGFATKLKVVEGLIRRRDG